MRKIQNKSELHQSCDFEFNVCPFCNLGYKFCLLFLSSAVVFFPKCSFRNTIRESNSFSPDQSSLIRMHTVCIFRLSADDTRYQSVKNPYA